MIEFAAAATTCSKQWVKGAPKKGPTSVSKWARQQCNYHN